MHAEISAANSLRLVLSADEASQSVMGMTEMFTWEPVLWGQAAAKEIRGRSKGACVILELPAQAAGSYLQFKLAAANGADVIESEPIRNPFIEYERLSLRYMESCPAGAPDGKMAAVSIRGRKMYDTYRLFHYDVKHDAVGGLICESEDPVIVLPEGLLLSGGDEVHVRACAYKKTEDGLALAGISDIEPDKAGYAFDLQVRASRPEKPVLSVVIPVYNAAGFLARTLDAVLMSTLPEMEVILVEDCSTDRSPEICEWYRSRFPCVELIRNKENSQVSKSRNTGLGASRGKYVAVLDNDDIVHPYMYELLCAAAEKDGTDCAIARTVIREGIKNYSIGHGDMSRETGSEVVSNREMYSRIHTSTNIFFVAVWNKVLKRETALLVPYPEDYPDGVAMYEDSAYTGALYSYIDRFTFVNDAFYIWDKRRQHTSGTASTEHSRRDPNLVWRAFIYAHSYPIVEGSRSNELAQKMNFQRICQSFSKFKESDPLYPYWVEHMRALVEDYKLYENDEIMSDQNLREWVRILREE